MVATVVTLLLSACEAASNPGMQQPFPLAILVRALFVGAAMGVMLYLLSLPMIIVAFRCGFYRERLQKNLSLEADGR